MQKYSDSELQEVSNIIKNGGIIVFPTETVYGIGANGFDEKAIKRLYDIKERPLNQPTSLLVSNIDMINQVAKNITKFEYALIKEFFPGPLTIILKKKDIVPDILSANTDTIGVRMPANKIALKLIDYAGVPIAAPSANISGKPSGTSIKNIRKDFEGKVDYFVDDGDSKIGFGSTIVQVVEGIPHILRKGYISEKQIKAVCTKQKIKEKLFELAEEKYKEFHSKSCPGINNILGIRVPILRNYAKELAKEYEIKEVLKQIDNEYYEEIMLQGMLIGLAKQDFKTTQKQIEEFVPKIDNWAVCDSFCAGLKVTKKYKKEMWDFIQKYLKSDKEFEIRFGVVMILDYYIEDEYLEKTFKIFDLITNQDYYVQMAVAWALAECFIKFYDRTIKYFETAKLDCFTYNKALQKAIESYRITDEQKDVLRGMKK